MNYSHYGERNPGPLQDVAESMTDFAILPRVCVCVCVCVCNVSLKQVTVLTS